MLDFTINRLIREYLRKLLGFLIIKIIHIYL